LAGKKKKVGLLFGDSQKGWSLSYEGRAGRKKLSGKKSCNGTCLINNKKKRNLTLGGLKSRILESLSQ